MCPGMLSNTTQHGTQTSSISISWESVRNAESQAPPHPYEEEPAFNYLGALKIEKLWSSHHGAAKMNLTRNHEVVGLIPGLAQWVEDQVLPHAAVQVTDVAWIWHCCGSGVGLQQELQLNPSLGTSICCI